MLKTEKFEFTVIEPGDRDWRFRDDGPAKEWAVYLPHQCSEWDIAGDADAGQWSLDPLPDNREQVIRDLEDFISEAQMALDWIKYYARL